MKLAQVIIALAAATGCRTPEPAPSDTEIVASEDATVTEDSAVSTADTAGPDSTTSSGGFVETPCGPEIADMVCVPAGPFIRGSAAGEADEQPERVLELSAFWIDRTEVTASRYASCVADGACPPRGSGSDCSESEDPERPADCVTWLGARDFCAWEGKRLPTEAEWEKAARGDAGAVYPWGSAPATCELAVMEEVTGEAGCGTGAAVRVGSRLAGASPYGALDMAGNIEEWVVDWYESDYYAMSPDRDPPGPEASVSQRRARRGGNYSSEAERLRSSRRSSGLPDVPVGFVGFRCAQ